MFVARDERGQPIGARRGVQATCPLCHEPVRPKCGQLVAWHFAHHAGEDCDSWSEGETPWHRQWKETVPIDRREVVMGAHRADIVAADRTVVELQHSPIGPQEIAARELHYRRMVWVFDVEDPFEQERLVVNYGKRGWQDPFRTFTWKHCRTSLATCQRPIYLDWGGAELLKVRSLHHEFKFWGGYGFLEDRDEFVAWLNQSPEPNPFATAAAWKAA
jgi:hypothetical protein